MGTEALEQESEAARPSLLSRRGALKLLMLTSAGLVAGGPSASAFFDFFSSFESVSPANLKSLNIPDEWLRQLGGTLPTYAGFLQKQQLKRMTVRQLIEPHTHMKRSVQNTLPPRAMWQNIRATLKVVDSLSARLGNHIVDVSSVYRSPAYNALWHGAKSNSYHMRNNAMDVIFDCPPGKVAAMARAMKAAGLYKGGVGRYPGFTHLDTRGYNADW